MLDILVEFVISSVNSELSQIALLKVYTKISQNNKVKNVPSWLIILEFTWSFHDGDQTDKTERPNLVNKTGPLKGEYQLFSFFQ